MKKLLSCKRGNIAVTFALASMPIFGSVGLAIDYSRAVNVADSIQNYSDGAALSAAQDGPTGDTSAQVDYMRSAITQRFGPGHWIDQLQIKSKWLSTTDIQVTATGEVPVTILAALPGFPSEVPVSVSATARIAEPKFIYTPPTVTQLDPDAADYNRIYVYCFDPKKKNKTKARTQMTAIADNAGTKYTYQMPSCDPGQMLSYKLMNVRNARTNSSLWDNKNAERYEYFTDTVMKDEAESYDLDGKAILETVLCDTAAQCRPKSQGGILEEGPNRTPTYTKKACTSGKYLYYGWEDRPPKKLGDQTDDSDQDYNDIRIVIRCATNEAVGDRQVRLIR